LAIRKGTSLITLATAEGIVVAADDLMYVEKEGKAIPIELRMRKVFTVESNLLIGSAGTVKNKSIEYHLENWIADLIAEQHSTSVKRPSDMAHAINAKMRTTFKPIETLVEQGRWSSHGPGDRVVSHVVAGYSEKFRQPHIFELGAEVNSEGNRLVYVSRPHHLTELVPFFCLGEDKFWRRAKDGINPERFHLCEIVPKVIEDTASALPDIPRALQESIALAVSFIKVEAKFNKDRVGQTVNVAVIDRAARKSYAAVL
jgi:hypothetical protein